MRVDLYNGRKMVVVVTSTFYIEPSIQNRSSGISESGVSAVQ